LASQEDPGCDNPVRLLDENALSWTQLSAAVMCPDHSHKSQRLLTHRITLAAARERSHGVPQSSTGSRTRAPPRSPSHAPDTPAIHLRSCPWFCAPNNPTFEITRPKSALIFCVCGTSSVDRIFFKLRSFTLTAGFFAPVTSNRAGSPLPAYVLYLTSLPAGTMHLYVPRLPHLRQRESGFVHGESISS
jgi:hypothetical protein